MPERLLIPDDGTHDRDLARKVGRAELARRLLLGFLVVGILALLVVASIGVVLIRDTQVGNRSTLANTEASAKAAQRTAARVEDCTTPGRPCFDEGQARTAEAVADINRVIVMAAACAAGLPAGLSEDQRVIRTQRCVIDQLAAEKP